MVIEVSLLTLFPIEGYFSGLHGVLFSLLALYWCDIPPFYRFTLFGIPANSKMFTYFLASQVSPPLILPPTPASLSLLRQCSALV